MAAVGHDASRISMPSCSLFRTMWDVPFPTLPLAFDSRSLLSTLTSGKSDWISPSRVRASIRNPALSGTLRLIEPLRLSICTLPSERMEISMPPFSFCRRTSPETSSRRICLERVLR